MKWIKKELDKIPYKPYPANCNPDRKELVLLAERVNYQDVKILVATFYRASTQQPFCRVFLDEDTYTTKMCETGKWSAASLGGIHLDGGWWTLDHCSYTYEMPTAIKAANAHYGSKYKWLSGALSKIDRHQSSIRWDKQKAKSQKRAEEDRLIIDDVLSQTPPLPDDIERQILDGPLKESRYIFYRTAKVRDPLTGLQERRVYGFCSNCMKEHELLCEPNHKERAYWCPKCKCEATAYKRGLGRKRLKDVCQYAVFTPTGRNVIARFYEVRRDYSGDPEKIKTDLIEIERYYFTEGKAYKLTRYVASAFGGKWIQNDFEVRRRIQEDIYNYDIHPYTEETFKGTVLEHAHFDDYIRQARKSDRYHYPMQYLACYCREPSIEHLLGAGLFRFVQARVHHDAAANRAIDWSAARPRDMLGVSQPELEQIKALDMSCNDFEAYKTLKPAGVKLCAEDKPIIRFFAGYGYGRDSKEENPITTVKRWGLKESVKYLRYQHRKAYKGNTEYHTIWNQLKDYHNMARELGYDLNNSYYFMPPNLKKAHDKAAELQLKQKELELAEKAKAEAKQWAAIGEALKGLEYTNGTLIIRPARSRAELVNEGKVQKHCIAGYADRVLRGETCIWFIRREDQPASPYYALNTSPAPKFEFRQCHGYDNDDHLPGGQRPQEIKDFEAEWYEKAVKPWQKKQEREKIKALQSTAKKQPRERVLVGA